MEDKACKVLVLGATGMLGNAMFRVFAQSEGFIAFGTLRGSVPPARLAASAGGELVCGVDVENSDRLTGLLGDLRPDVVVNCIGIVKQLSLAEDPLATLPINSLLPHRIARLCALVGSRLVHFSTDCVFSGSRGNYTEQQIPDANDLYGRSKYLGEVDYPHAVTLRTSIIGHELHGARSLISWFLAQEGRVRGYSRAVFSGLPTVEMARVVRDLVLPRTELRGLYHVSADPIDKHSLLGLVAAAYGKAIEIEADDRLIIDRSLDSTRFRAATGYRSPPWPELVQSMRQFG